MNNRPNEKKQEFHINRNVAITILITLCAFVACLTVMITCMIMDAADDSYVPQIGLGGDKDNTDKPDKPVSSTSRPGDKTGIILPGVTAEGERLGVVGDYTQDVTDDTDIDSAAIVLVDITDNKVIAGKGFDQKVYPASMTKVMTLLIACENAKDPNALLTVTEEMIDEYKKSSNEGASVAFEWKAGYQVTVEDALHLVIYQSDTFACWLLAEHVSGGEDAFVELMNAKAASLGCTGTNFKNCTGLYNEQHYTTCRDMAAIMAAAMSNPAAKAVLGSYELYKVDIYEGGEISGEPMGMWCAWYTSRLEAYKYANTAPYYAGKGSDIRIVGGKTGYETVPMSCFVTAGVDTETGREYVCVQVGRLSKEDKEINTSASTYDTRTMYWKYAKEPE